MNKLVLKYVNLQYMFGSEHWKQDNHKYIEIYVLFAGPSGRAV